MPANTQPIFPITPVVGAFGALLSTAMTAAKAFDGTEVAGTSLVILGTLGANGNRMDTVRVNYSALVGSIPSGQTNETMVRLWANSGVSNPNTVAANNMLLHPGFKIASINWTTVLAQGIQLPEIVIPIFDALPTGTRILAGLTTAIGGTNAALALRLSSGDF